MNISPVQNNLQPGKPKWPIPMLAILFALMLGLSGCGGGGSTGSNTGSGTGAGLSGSGI